MDVAFSSLGRENYVIKIFVGKPERKDKLGDLGVDGRVVLRYSVSKAIGH
jgi:hypothetical protein